MAVNNRPSIYLLHFEKGFPLPFIVIGSVSQARRNHLSHLPHVVHLHRRRPDVQLLKVQRLQNRELGALDVEREVVDNGVALELILLSF